jgi:hypothetical protein
VAAQEQAEGPNASASSGGNGQAVAVKPCQWYGSHAPQQGTRVADTAAEYLKNGSDNGNNNNNNGSGIDMQP